LFGLKSLTLWRETCVVFGCLSHFVSLVVVVCLFVFFVSGYWVFFVSVAYVFFFL
jgi:hypothetical protein